MAKATSQDIDAQIAAQLASIPTGSDEKPLSPIGVPKGYVANIDPMDNTIPWQEAMRASVNNYQVPATQTADDVWRPANYPPGTIAKLQSSMLNAGLYKPGAKFRLGMWDSASRDAWKEALSVANASGRTPQATVARYGTMMEAGTSNLLKSGVTGTTAATVVEKKKKGARVPGEPVPISTGETVPSVESAPDITNPKYVGAFGG